MNMKKLFSVLMCLCLAAALLSAVAYAAPEEGLCPHHTAHDPAVCGYVAPSAGASCTHVCSAELGCTAASAEVPCGHVCSVEQGCTAAVAEQPCTDVHVHDALCGYAEAVAAVCVHVHDGACGYTAPYPGTPCNHSCDIDEGCQNMGYCTHVHNAECNYTPAIEGTPCTHICSAETGCTLSAEAKPCTYVHTHNESCGYAPSVPATCAHPAEHDSTCGYAPAKEASCAHTSHDSTCGYAPVVEEVVCTYAKNCPDCNPFLKTVVTVASAGSYDGTAKTPAVTVSIDGVELVENTDYTLTYSNNINAGEDSAVVTIDGIGTYAGQRTSAYFSIAPAELTVSISTEHTKVYGEADPEFVYTVSGLVAPDTAATTLGGSLVRGSGDNVGAYNIYGGTLASTNSNYVLKKVETGKLTITPKPATVTAADQNLVYGETVDQAAATAATVTGLLEGHALYTIVITPSTTDVTDAGTLTPSKAVISAVIGGKTYNVAKNYEFTYVDGALTISPKEVTPIITLSPDRYAYTGAECKPTVTLKDGTTVIPDSEYTVSYANNVNIGTGTATVTDKDGGNYIIKSVSVPFSIVQQQAYSIISGNGQTYTSANYYGMSFVTNAPAANLQGVYVDNQLVSTSYYTVTPYTNAAYPGVNGSTITLSTSLMNLVSNGTHTILFKYSDGQASGTFIKGAASINGVKTGDDSNIGLLAALMCLGLMGSVAILPVFRKQKNR